MDSITIQAGDEITAATDPEGYPAVKIQNRVWVEGPRYLVFDPPSGDQRSQIDALIDALTALRDTQR